MIDTIVTGGRVVGTDGVAEATIAIDDGIIVAIGERDTLPGARDVVDATGKLVLPGVVDPHVHFDDALDRVGTYETETSAGALGGVTTVMDFAWQGGKRGERDEVGTIQEGIEHKRRAGENSVIDFALHGAIKRERKGVLDEMEEVMDRGVTSFKLFMTSDRGQPGSGIVGTSSGFTVGLFEQVAALDAVATVHPEDPSVCDYWTDELQSAGKGDPTSFPASRPDYAEAIATEKALRIATAVGAKYYGVHTSSRVAAEVLERFREDGSRVRSETCTHYLALDETAHERVGNLAKTAPPLRTSRDVEALYDALRRGVIDVVSTDHLAYERRTKEVEHWWESPYGVNQLQHTLPLVHTGAVVERGFSYLWLVRAMCARPARTFGLPGKGTLEPGTDADLVVFDPEATYTIHAADNASNADFSVYEGREVTGRVEKTFVRGTLVADEGNVVGDPGYGEFVACEAPTWEP